MAKKKPTRYTVTDGKMVLVLEPAEEGGYCVSCPFVPGLNTQGETLEDAFEMAYDAAEGLKVARANLRRRASTELKSETPPAEKARKKQKSASA